MAEDTPTTEDKKEGEGVAALAAGDAVPEESAPGTSNGADGANATNTKSSASASAQQPSNKKRRPGIQLNKDDHPEGHECNSDDNDELNDEGGKRTDPFKRASEDVLKKRKIVKASNKWGGGAGGNGGKSGLFGSVKLAPATAEGRGKGEKATESSKSTSVFGSGAKLPTFGSALGTGGSSGFGSAAGTSSGFGFGNVSSGFGSLKPTSSDSDKAENGEAKSSGFGGGGGSLGFGNAASSGFGSLKTTGGFGFGSAANDNSPSVAPGAAASSSNGSGLAGTFATSSASNKTNGSSPTKFPTSAVVDTANGEQNEDCVYQVRAKLFKMVPGDDTPETVDEKAEYSVPSTSRALEQLSKSSPEKGGQSTDKAKESSSAKGGGDDDDEKPKMVQKEAGIGPVRILKRKAPLNFGAKLEKDDKSDEKKETPSARVVQRQETCGGKSIRVILNVRLVPKTCNVSRRGDKFVQLNAPNSDGTLESSLFKVKTTAEADQLENKLKAMLQQ